MVVLSIFEKRALFPEFMWKRTKNPLQVRIADNSIMSHNEVIEGLPIELGGVQCIIPVLWATDQLLISWLLEIIFSDYILHAHRP